MIARERLVPLIVAVALFLENMDSTVISTSLPGDRGMWWRRRDGAASCRQGPAG